MFAESRWAVMQPLPSTFALQFSVMVLQPGYRSSTSLSSCDLCPQRSLALFTAIAVIILIAIAFAVLYVIIFKQHKPLMLLAEERMKTELTRPEPSGADSHMKQDRALQTQATTRPNFTYVFDSTLPSNNLVQLSVENSHWVSTNLLESFFRRQRSLARGLDRVCGLLLVC